MAKPAIKPDFVQRFENDCTAYFDLTELEDILYYYQDHNEHKKALQVINHAMDLHGNDPYMCWNKIAEYLALRKFDEVVKLKDSLLPFIINNEDVTLQDSAWMMIGKAYDLTGDPENAYKIYSKTLHSEHAKEISIYQDLCDIYEDHGNIDLAIETAEQAFKYYPEDEEVICDLARLYDLAEKYEEAIKIWNKAIDFDAFDPDLWLNLGKSYMKAGMVDEAVKSLQYAHTLDPDDSTINGLLGAALARNNNSLNAAEFILSNIPANAANDPKEINEYIPQMVMAAECFHSEEEYEKVVDLCYRIINVGQETPYLLCIMQDSLKNLSRYQEAVFLLKNFIKKYPNEIDLHLLLGDIYQGYLNQPVSALESYEKALELDPKETHALFASASICMQIDKPEPAMKLLQLIIQYGGHDKLPKFNLMTAMCHFALGHSDEAIAFLRKQVDSGDKNCIETFLQALPESEQLLAQYGLLNNTESRQNRNQ